MLHRRHLDLLVLKTAAIAVLRIPFTGLSLLMTSRGSAASYPSYWFFPPFS
jgi:hypothetical protein